MESASSLIEALRCGFKVGDLAVIVSCSGRNLWYKNEIGRVVRLTSNPTPSVWIVDNGRNGVYEEDIKPYKGKNKMLKKGKFIVGSVNKFSGAVSVASTPAQHGSMNEAVTEAARLSTKDTEKEFVVLEVKGIVKTTLE